MKKQGRWQELLRLMRRNGKIAAAGKIAAGAASITVLSVGGQHVWKQFQQDSAFHPELFANSQELHGNQITFPENEEYKGNEQTPDPGENELLQRDRRAEEDLGKQKQDQASFEMDAEDPNAFSGDMQNLLVTQDEQNPAAVPPSGLVGNTVLLTDGSDAENADTIYTGSSNGSSTGNTAGSGTAGSSASESGSGSGSGSGSDSAGGSGNGGGSGTAGGGSADTPQPDQPSNPDNPAPSPDPAEPDQPSDPNKVYDPDYPDDSKQPEPPNDPPYFDEEYPHFPEDGLSTDDDAECELIVTDAFDETGEILYEGAVLTDWKIFCSALFFIHLKNADGTTEQYRILEYSDCFRIGKYPKVAERGLTITFYFRPNTKCEWQEQQVTFDNIKYAKYVVLSDANSDNQAKELMAGYLDEGEAVSLSEATQSFFCAKPEWTQINSNDPDVGLSTRIMTEYFPGWSLEPGGELLRNDAFLPEKGGRYILYPLDWVMVPDGLEIQLWYNGYNFWRPGTFTQVLTQYHKNEKHVVIPDGIQNVQCGFPEDMDTLYIPGSVQQFFSIPRVGEAYEVAENSQFFHVADGVLYNADENQILGIPLKKTKLDVPESVEKIEVPTLNSLQEIVFHSETPPDMKIDELDHVKVRIPAGSYLNYFKAWGSIKNLEEYVVFETAENEDTDYIMMKDGSILSKNRHKLRRASASCYGLYIVPDGVEEIAPEAFEESEYIDSVMIPATVKKLDAQSLSASGIDRIYLYGRYKDGTIPAIDADEDTFLIYEAENEETGDKELVGPHIWVPAEERENYISAWKDTLIKVLEPEGLTEKFLTERLHEGFDYQTQNGITWMSEGKDGKDGLALLHVPSEIDSFEEIQQVLGTDEPINWTRIGAHAFGYNYTMTMLELPESVTEIDAEAFAHCTFLEAVFSHTEDMFYIGKAAFDNTPSLRFVVFNTKKILFERGSNMHGKVTCYVPYGNTQYYYPDDYITPFLPVAVTYGNFYTAVPGDDGYFVYGHVNKTEPDSKSQTSIKSQSMEAAIDNVAVTDLTETDEIIENEENNSEESGSDENTPNTAADIPAHSILIGATTNVSGTLSLPNADQYPLTQIKSEALQKCGEDEIIIPENLSSTIESIGMEAFSGSALAGRLIFTDALKEIGPGAFSKCSLLESIHFNGENPPALILPSKGMAYQFGFENADPKIEISVRDSKAYREDWKYYLSGYTPESMRSDIFWNCYEEKQKDWPGEDMSMGFMMYLSDLTDYLLELKLYQGDLRACELLGLPEPEKPALEEPNMDDYLAEDAGFDWFAAATPSNAELTDEILNEDGTLDPEDPLEEETDADSEQDDDDSKQTPDFLPPKDNSDDANSDDQNANTSSGSDGTGGNDANDGETDQDGSEAGDTDGTDSDGNGSAEDGSDTDNSDSDSGNTDSSDQEPSGDNTSDSGSEDSGSDTESDSDNAGSGSDNADIDSGNDAAADSTDSAAASTEA